MGQSEETLVQGSFVRAPSTLGTPDMSPQRRLVLLDELIGLRMENAELRFRLDQAIANLPLTDIDLTQTWTWRTGRLVMAPTRWARRLASFFRRAVRSLRRRWGATKRRARA